MITAITARTIAPYFSLARALWIPALYVEDAETGALRRVETTTGRCRPRGLSGDAD